MGRGPVEPDGSVIPGPGFLSLSLLLSTAGGSSCTRRGRDSVGARDDHPAGGTQAESDLPS
jgi:hypothetical protein